MPPDAACALSRRTAGGSGGDIDVHLTFVDGTVHVRGSGVDTVVPVRELVGRGGRNTLSARGGAGRNGVNGSNGAHGSPG